jgi:dipicolinate synthase subunit A
VHIAIDEYILIIGGDTRQKHLYYQFLNDGYHICTYSVPEIDGINCIEEYISKCNSIILPVPFSKDGLTILSNSENKLQIDYLLSLLNPFTKVYGGYFNKDFLSICAEKNISVYDISADKSFELMNSIATAEGAIAEAITHSSTNLHKSHCLVLGYGKCAKAIASRLKGLNCFVSIAARNPYQLSEAFQDGHNIFSLSELASNICKYNYIFNTIPAHVLTRNILRNVNSDAIIIDIASNPGGTEFDACKHYGIDARLCLSLPGKYAAKSSSQIIYQCIQK